MRSINSPQAMQRMARTWKQEGSRIGFVPTMGFLHEGHMSLVRAARKWVGAGGRVVVSIYVNPTQFGPKEDFSSYPRNLKRDRALCRAENVDAIFCPSDRTMYPEREARGFSTYVVEEQLSRGFEGTARPGHFRGVTTIVAKLFNCVLPDVAVFGAKDWQQAAVIQRMARDLNFPLKVVIAPTIREPDGLAMSSRNAYLNAEEREQAKGLFTALREARRIVRKSRQPIPAKNLKERLLESITAKPAARVDYIEFFDPVSLVREENVRRGTHLALAVYIGRTRLIDNGRL
jgi:pantoate--beta-alanine ligase